MKKISVFAVLLAVVLLFASCSGQQSEAAKKVDAMIKEMGRVGIDSADMLEDIRAAYEELDEEDKEQVKNLDALEEAEAKYENYVRINSEIAQMIEITNSGFTNAEMGISYLIERAEEIKAEYKKMSSFEKSQIKDYDKIDEAVEALKTLSENSLKPAAAYVKAFKTVNKGKNYTITGVYCIKNIREEGTEYHFFALTYNDGSGEDTAVYSRARCTADISADTIASRPEIFFASEPAADSADAVTNGNVELVLEDVLAEAEK